MKKPDFPIRPEVFWSVFSANLRAEWKNPRKKVSSLYNSKSEWTQYIIEFLDTLSTKFGCISDIEYWPRVDVGYFDRMGDNWADWSWEAAIEHENGLHWHEEICKLLTINAGLKVLIAYSDSKEEHQGILKRFIQIHRSRKYYTIHCGWLFIIGPRQIPANKDFDAFKFDRNQIVEITDGIKTLL